MKTFKLPLDPNGWKLIRDQSKVTTTQVKNDLGAGYVSYIYRLEAGKTVSYWKAVRLLNYYNKKK